MAGCGHTGHYFGAIYEDGACIDGYMWDLDSCDTPGGGLHIGGEIPCPECNAEAFIKQMSDQVEEAGYWSGHDGEPCIPPVEKWREIGRAAWSRAWRKGWVEGEADRASRGDDDE